METNKWKVKELKNCFAVVDENGKTICKINNQICGQKEMAVLIVNAVNTYNMEFNKTAEGK